MTVEANMVVTLNYKLSNHKTGEKIEETTAENPMVFLFGVGGIIPEFEDNIQGKKVGDTFDFAIVSESAYGEKSAEQIVKIPTSVFNDESGKFNEEHIFVGAMVPMSDNEGNHLRGTVLAVTDEHVEMDFNHPLAGTDLNFKGEIVEIRPATQEEIDHGHVHGLHGHQH
ncbi:MAG: FKBP-type peptidyl-prolyl cis-trans isomerase [Flavobacteriia bacterium]|nr:FKBP-type peptidyl-prolyl cis-trans isomerase [Flavobacteriia bacterium]